VPKVRAGDIELYYEEHGSGSEPLVLMHGFTQSHTHWQGLIRQLPLDRLRVLAFDSRGHGRSDKQPSGYTISQHADDIAAATRALGIETFNFAGHSMGGQIGMALAARHPERLRRLILVASGPSEGLRAFDPFLREAARASIGDAETYWAWIETWAARPILSTLLSSLKAQYEPMTIEYLDEAFDGICEDLSDRLTEVNVPTLVVAGDRDVLREANLKDAARIPSCALHVFYRTGHMIEMERPEELSALIADFIEHGVPAAAPASSAA
jgi:(E)-2-((N-methylformamido)methylene)succinate hydrolase